MTKVETPYSFRAMTDKDEISAALVECSKALGRLAQTHGLQISAALVHEASGSYSVVAAAPTAKVLDDITAMQFVHRAASLMVTRLTAESSSPELAERAKKFLH